MPRCFNLLDYRWWLLTASARLRIVGDGTQASNPAVCKQVPVENAAGIYKNMSTRAGRGLPEPSMTYSSDRYYQAGTMQWLLQRQ